MRYIFIASCTVNSARFAHTLISDVCAAYSLCQMTYIAYLRKYNTGTTSVCADMRLEFERREANLMSLAFFISFFNAQHVSDVNTSIFRSLRLIC